MPRFSTMPPAHLPRLPDGGSTAPRPGQDRHYLRSNPYSPPPEYASREGTSTSDQDSIEEVASSDTSQLEKPYHKGTQNEKHDSKPKREKPFLQDKGETPNKPEKKPDEPEKSAILVILAILHIPEKTPWCWLLVALVIILFAVLFPILWIQSHQKADFPGAVVANTTSTVTTTVSHPVTQTTSLIVTSVSVSIVSTTPTHTTSTSTPVPTPTVIGGFAAIQYEDDYGDSSVSLFWVNNDGTIKELDSQGNGGWSDAGTFASGVRVGSAMSHTYPTTSTYDALFYVDQNYIINDYYADYGWTAGSLSALGLKTSESMNFMACAPWATNTSGTNNLAEMYVFYNSSHGDVRMAQLWEGEWQMGLNPPFVANGVGFVGCESDYDGNLLAYIVNADGHLEQWQLDKDAASPWTLDFRHPGPFSRHSTIQAVIASLNPDGRSHIFLQTPSHMIVRLDTAGLGVDTAVVGKADIAVAVPGTRMTASGNCNSTVTLYYQMNGTEMMQWSMVDDAVSNAVFPQGGGDVQGDMPFGNGVGSSPGSMGWLSFWCLVGVLFVIL